MKLLLNFLVVIGVIALLVYGAFDESSPVRGRVLGALLLVASLPLFLVSIAVYDAVKIRRQKRVSWRKAFFLANNQPPELYKSKKDKL